MARHHTQYPRLGELITRLIRSLAASKGWTMEFTMDFVGGKTVYGRDMVYRWRQGRSCPSHANIEILAQLGKEEALLDREWGEALLRSVYHPDVTTVVNKLWGVKVTHPILCNLPSPEYTELIGRQAELTRLLELLSPHYGAHIITVDGIGGVGKTSLVLEAAYRCLRVSTGEVSDRKTPTFDAIIFVTAKQQFLTSGRILSKQIAQRTLRDIFREVSSTLGTFDVTVIAPADQPVKVREALAHQRSLLIVDNLETMENSHDIVSFLFELPPAVKIVITTRERVISYSPLRLKELSEEEALRLIAKQAQEQGIAVKSEQAYALYQRIGGIPAALVYSVGQIASDYSVDLVIDEVRKATGDVARFCFQESVRPLRGQEAHSLLMSLAMFPIPPLRTALAHTAGLTADFIAVEHGLGRLRQLSLVNQQEDGRFGMLPLTREYALAELAAHAEFEQEARKRCVEWYLKFTQEFGGDDWDEWHIRYDKMEEEWESLLAVFDWCATQNLYEEIRTFWLIQATRGGVTEFTSIYGYWDDRLTWLDWLHQEAERRADWATAVETLNRMGFTLTLMGQLRHAEEILQRAQEFQKYAPAPIQVNLAQNTGVLHIHKRDFQEAYRWLDRADELLDTSTIIEPERSRWWINSRYHRGTAFYEQKDYAQAEGCFRDVLQGSQTIQWERAAIYARNHLANIAIAQERYDEAESLLQTGRTVSERNKDKRRTAHYDSSLAYLFQRRGNTVEAASSAEKALVGFRRLGMQKEAREMEEMVAQLRS